MKTIRQYPNLCPACNGSGLINDYFPATSTPKITCPVCSGSGIITVTETTVDDYVIEINKPEK